MAIRKTAAKKTTASRKAKVAPKKKTAAKKVTTAAKRAVKKTVKKVSPKKQKPIKVGTGYECSVCGLEVSVEKVCGCADTCDIICCGEPMEMI